MDIEDNIYQSYSDDEMTHRGPSGDVGSREV